MLQAEIGAEAPQKAYEAQEPIFQSDMRDRLLAHMSLPPQERGVIFPIPILLVAIVASADMTHDLGLELAV
eukprot:268442-Rhodomonas_salina.1